MADETGSRLRRSLSLPMIVLYGLGVTIGAGIYVLLGATASKAGVHAPVAFILAAFVMAFSAASFSELATRLPVSAGEAAYVRTGFNSQTLSLIVGLMVIGSGVVSSAAITVGSTGYITELIAIDATLLVILIIGGVGAVAAWGIMESVAFASLFTLVEAGALIVVIWAGIDANPDFLNALPTLVTGLESPGALAGVASAGLLAFFAFIGFEDIVNLAEEAKEPERALPWAIGLTLVIATVIYVLVAAVAVLSLPIDELAASKAPVSLVFERLTGFSPVIITLIAIVATLNGVIIQMIMASRVTYGLARQGSLPAVLGQVNPRTHTPLVATAVVAGIVLTLALLFPLQALAEWTSRIALTVFLLCNLSLLLIKRRGEPAPAKAVIVPAWVPVMGTLTCFGLLLSDLVL